MLLEAECLTVDNRLQRRSFYFIRLTVLDDTLALATCRDELHHLKATYPKPY